jgi:hypothetical protein
MCWASIEPFRKLRILSTNLSDFHPPNITATNGLESPRGSTGYSAAHGRQRKMVVPAKLSRRPFKLRSSAAAARHDGSSSITFYNPALPLKYD